MKRRRVTIAAALMLLSTALTASTYAQRFEMRAEYDGGEPSYNVSFSTLSREYAVPYADLCVMHNAGVVAADIPVILYIHQRSPYSLRQIYSLRLRGATWAQLSNWCGVPLYVENGRCVTTSGPPYGNAYGYYAHAHGHGKHWKADRGDRGR